MSRCRCWDVFILYHTSATVDLSIMRWASVERRRLGWSEIKQFVDHLCRAQKQQETLTHFICLCVCVQVEWMCKTMNLLTHLNQSTYTPPYWHTTHTQWNICSLSCPENFSFTYCVCVWIWRWRKERLH